MKEQNALLILVIFIDIVAIAIVIPLIFGDRKNSRELRKAADEITNRKENEPERKN